ncbi:outer membrane protein [Catalinimonas alkaloidigena]|uniref:TolC family protein n=1 Tax=Catalinimonas alkaloidigena TaxID=1075417 RepID=UPI0024059276|nr:TolC family protein [Catalinimonas alkaloidigena]MDF9795791.1 outer membrane protein [Catalinimonas alkaloidigena]
MNKRLCYKLIFVNLSLIFFFHSSTAQESPQIVQEYTLEEIITLAKEQSPSSLFAETRKQNRFWAYRSFMSEYRPQLYLSGDFPFYQRSNNPITQPDGSIEFRRVNQNLTSLNLGVRQVIGLTGGSIFIESEMQRFDNFETDQTTYSGNPAVIGFEQQLFGFNPYKWDKEIAPLQYEESLKEYAEDMEELSIQATNLFFDVLLAQINLELAEKNLSSNDTVYQISEGRYNLGKIGENELLRVEFNVMKSRQEVAQARLDLETSTLRLRSFIGLNNTESFVLALPDDIPEFEVNEQTAISEALKNNPNTVEFARQIKEAERDMAEAKGNTGLNASLEATYGLTNRADDFPDIYNNPENQQRLGVSFFIPIVNWGRQKSIVKTQEALLNLTQYQVDQERINFEQEVYTQVKTYQMLRNKVEITEISNDIAARKYEITKQRYLIGKINITDLIISLQEKDQARRDYIQALNDFWTDYYNLRALTLYDFEAGQSLLTPDIMQGYE